MGRGTDSEQRAYLGSFTSAGGHGITTASVDPATGALTALHHTRDAVPDPSFLTVAPGGGVLYAVSESDDGGAAALSLGGPDGPAPLGPVVPVEGAGPTHLALAGDGLYTANYTSGSVSALRVAPDGGLAGPARVHPHTGGGPHADRQEGPHAHAVVPDPSGRWLLCTDLGTDSVWIYDLRDDDRTGGTGPRPHREAPLRAGTGPRHLAFPAGPGAYGSRVYVINELDSTVTTCRWDAESGELEPLGETRTLPDGAVGQAAGQEATAGANFPSALVLSPDARFAWAANRGDDSVAVLALEGGADGVAELLTTVPCGGHWPRDLAVDPAGRRLYAANERSGDVTWFEIDPGTGVPRRTGSLEVPAASCVVFG